jgi:hypothetical protein
MQIGPAVTHTLNNLSTGVIPWKPFILTEE